MTSINDLMPIIDPTDYKGHLINTFNPKTGLCDFTVLGFEEYKALKGNENLICISWDEYFEKYQNPWNKSLCGDFQEITEEQFDTYMGAVPPKRLQHLNGGLTFFIGECHTSDLYNFCFYSNGKYYTALRPITLSNDELISEIANTPRIPMFRLLSTSLDNSEPQIEPMIEAAVETTQFEMYDKCDFGQLVSNETQYDFLSEMSEKGCKFFKSQWGQKPCYFISHTKALLVFVQ